MPQETRPESFVLRQLASAELRQLPTSFIERVSVMKPAVIMMMLHDSARDGRDARIGIVGQWLCSRGSRADAPIGHAQPVGHGSSRYKVRIVKKSIAVSEVIHARDRRPLSVGNRAAAPSRAGSRSRCSMRTASTTMMSEVKVSHNRPP